MKKLLVIGKEGRLARYTADSSLFDRYDIVYYVPVGTDDGTILELHSDANYILVDAVADVSASLIEGMPDLKLIHSEGVGYQGVDTEKAAARGIYVCNCKGMNAAAVAEQAVLLMLGLLRDVKGGDESVRSGKQIETKERYMLEGSLRELGDCTCLLYTSNIRDKRITDMKNALLREKARNKYMLESKSPRYRQMLEMAEKAAASESNIMLFGESGSGKEVLATFIHERSNRKDASLLDLNCQALSDSILESELFGHEKGSFTGCLLYTSYRTTSAFSTIGDFP